jgi:hypothetical protein
VPVIIYSQFLPAMVGILTSGRPARKRLIAMSRRSALTSLLLTSNTARLG